MTLGIMELDDGMKVIGEVSTVRKDEYNNYLGMVIY